jgi:hypothetical protein
MLQELSQFNCEIISVTEVEREVSMDFSLDSFLNRTACQLDNQWQKLRKEGKALQKRA